MRYIFLLLLLTGCGLQPFPDEHISFDLDIQSGPKQAAVKQLNNDLTPRP